MSDNENVIDDWILIQVINKNIEEDEKKIGTLKKQYIEESISKN